jgi:transposase-like protein
VHRPEQIIRKLREAEVELGGGAAVADVCKKLGISEQTYFRWRNQYGGLKADDMKRLKDLEQPAEEGRGRSDPGQAANCREVSRFGGFDELLFPSR